MHLRPRRLRFERIESRIAPSSMLLAMGWTVPASAWAHGGLESLDSGAADSDTATTPPRRSARIEGRLAPGDSHTPALLESGANDEALLQRALRRYTPEVRDSAPLVQSRGSLLDASLPALLPLEALLKTPAANLNTTAIVTASGGADNASSGGGSARGAVAAAGAVDVTAAPTAPATIPSIATTGTTAGDSQLALVDSSGQALSLTIDSNTLVVGAASWCSACAAFKEALVASADEVAGLRIVFAFSDEGGDGPGGVTNGAFLENLPGEVAFLGAGSARPDRFPMAFNTATGAFDNSAFDAVGRWLAGGEIAQPLAAQPALALMDANGSPLALTLDANTMVVGSATWCGATQKFVAALRTPEVAAQLDGLRVIFAFDNEGGEGPGGVLDGAFLDNLPGEVAFLAAGSVRPERLPTVFNPTTGAFDLSAVDAVNAWVAGGDVVTGGTCGNKNLAVAEATPSGQSAVGSGQEGAASGGVLFEPRPSGSGVAYSAACQLVGDYNSDGLVDAADYTVYRDTLGGTGDLRADGDGSGVIDTADYDLWVANYGQTCAAAPGQFAITGPLEILQYERDTTITWEAAQGATSYRFRLSQLSDLSAPAYDEIVTGTSRTVNIYNGMYYVGITAINDAGTIDATNDGFAFRVDIPAPDQLIFVTSSTFRPSNTTPYPPNNATFKGPLGADYHCTKLAASALLLPEPWDGHTIHFRAMLTNADVGIKNRAGMQNGAYVNTAGALVATNLTNVIFGNHTAPLLTQGVNPVPVSQVWTGAGEGGAATTNCLNWTDPTGSGMVGVTGATGSDWLSAGIAPCVGQFRLYCVGRLQVDSTATFEEIAPGNTVTGSAGIAFGSNWLVSDDTLGGQLVADGNYVNLTAPVSTLTWSGDLRFDVPTLVAGAAGLAGFTVRAKDAGGVVLDSVTIDPVAPGQQRGGAQYRLLVNAATYEFTRIENPTVANAPAPIDNLRIPYRGWS